MGNSPNDGPLTKPSLGQDVQLGMLYDYRTSSLFAGVSLWDHDVVNPPEEASTTSVQNADYRFSSSLDEARSNAQLDVEGSLTLDLGIVHVTGSAKYLSIKKSSAHEARVDVSCTITRRTRRVSQETLAKIQYPSRLEDARFTHFVAEVVEGGTATLTFARTCNSADDEEQVQGQLAATLKGANFIEGKVKLDYQNDEHQLKDTVRITYSGAMAESVATLEDASRIAKNMPTQLMNQMNTLSYKLVPLSVLDSKAARELRKLDTVLVERTSAVLKAAEAVLLDDVFVSQAERGVKIAAIQSQISRFKQAYTRAHGAFQATVKDLLPKLYDGKTEDYAGKFAELERAVTLHELRTDVAKTFASRKSDEAMYLQRMTDDLKANGKFENFVDDRSFQPRLNGPKYLILSFAGKGLGVVESWLDKLNDPLKVTTIKDVCIQDEVNRDRIHSSYLALKALCEAQDVAVDMPDQVAFGVAHIPTLGNNETLVGDVVFVDGGTFKVVTGTLPSGNLDFTPNVSRITQTSATVDLPWEVRKEEAAFPTTAIHVCWRHRPAKNASKPTWDGAVTVLRSLGSPTVELQPLEPNADYDIQLCLYTALGPTSWSRVKRLQTAKMQRPLNATDIVTIKNRGSGGMLKNIGDAGVVVVDDEKLSQHCQWRRVPSQSGAVAFVNVGSGLYLDHYLNKTVLVSDGGTFNTCQQWTQEKTADGFCVIKSRSSGTVLSLRTRPSLHTSVSNHDISNQWKITKLDGGVVTITSRLCDLALGNPKGSRLEWCNDSGATNCQWRRIPTTDGYVTYENVVTKLFLESENEKTVGNQVPALTLPLAHFIHKLMNGLDGSAKIRAESCWYERVSPTLRAIITGQPVILESHERRERFYYPDKGFAYDSSRQNVFSWRPRWTPDGTKDQWRVIPSNRSDQFYLQSVYSNEFLYAADHHKQGDISRVFAWRSDTPVGDMGLWQLVDVDPTQRDVFVLYNPYQKQYLYSPNDSYDNNRRFVWTATHRENDTEWEQQRRWRITPATYPPMERGVEAFFRKQYPDAVALLTTALDEVQDQTERVKCHVYRMAANLRMGMTHQLQADYDRIRAIGVDTTAIFNGLHHLWVEIATFLNVPTAAVEDDTIRGFVRALENFAPSTSDAQQQWKELDAGGGFVTIENRSSTRYLACQTAQSVESINDKSTDFASQWQIQSI